jgi:thiamine biosynthesis lipoprotein
MRWLRLLALAVPAACGSPTGDSSDDFQPQPGASAAQQVEVRAGERAAAWETHRRTGAVMGTSMDLTLRLPSGQGLRARALLDAAEAELRRIQALMTTWEPSALTALNDAAGQGPVPVPPELARLVARALFLASESEGAFDPTWKALDGAWKFESDDPVLPGEADLAPLLERVDWSRVVVDLEANTVSLPAGFELGLGGIAKGYGVDRAMAVWLAEGVKHGIVDAGGDLKALGTNDDGPWEIAIKHPRRRDEILAVIPVSNACVVTSGDYERFFEVDGQRYHHILDPRDGRPSRGAMSATVLGPDAAACDALATALCVLSPAKGLELIERSPRFEALIVDLEGEVHVSPGLAGAVR